MNQTNHFYDVGYGWMCKHCSTADSEAYQRRKGRGFFSNNDPPEKPKHIGPPLASWTDQSRHSLFCPRCGIHETIRQS